MEDINMILSAYSDAASRPGGTRLEEWVRRYPQHERALVQFALFNFLFERGGAAAEVTPAQETRFLERAALIRQKMMQSATLARQSRMRSLIEAAKERGLSVPALAERLFLTPLEIVKLNQRLIRAATIPNALVQQLASLLERSREEIVDYLRLPPTVAAQANYRADRTPHVQEPQDFREALMDSPNLSEDHRAYWLAQAQEARDDREG
jgi:hypothetical protein